MTTKQLEEYLAGRRIYSGGRLYQEKDKVKITSIKIWERLKTYSSAGDSIPKFRIGWKFGLYKFGDITNFSELHQFWLSEWEHNSFLQTKEVKINQN